MCFAFKLPKVTSIYRGKVLQLSPNIPLKCGREMIRKVLEKAIGLLSIYSNNLILSKQYGFRHDLNYDDFFNLRNKIPENLIHNLL